MSFIRELFRFSFFYIRRREKPERIEGPVRAISDDRRTLIGIPEGTAFADAVKPFFEWYKSETFRDRIDSSGYQSYLIDWAYFEALLEFLHELANGLHFTDEEAYAIRFRTKDDNPAFIEIYRKDGKLLFEMVVSPLVPPDSGIYEDTILGRE